MRVNIESLSSLATIMFIYLVEVYFEFPAALGAMLAWPNTAEYFLRKWKLDFKGILIG